MKKNEYIQKLERIRRSKPLFSTDLYSEGRNSAYNTAIKIANSLNEPKTPIIPQFVADYLTHKSTYTFEERIMFLLKSNDGDSYYFTEQLPDDKHITQDEGDALYEYAAEEKIETLLHLINGFTVEKDSQQYVVRIGHGYFCGYDELKIVFILDNQPGSMNTVIKYSDKTEAQSIADAIGGIVEPYPK